MKEFFDSLFRGEWSAKNKVPEKTSSPIIIESLTPERREQIKSSVKTREEIILETFNVEKVEKLQGGSHRIELIKLQNDGSGIFKPKNKEAIGLRTHAKAGTQYKRERAAYVLDRFLGFELVPTTIIREIDGIEGSFQRFVEDAPTAVIYAREKRDNSDEFNNQIVKLWIFDYIIYSSDRHAYNLLVKPAEDKIYAIDNGLSFGPDILRQYKDFFDTPLPPEVGEKLEKFLAWPEGRRVCEELLGELLSKDEVAACILRIEKISSILKKHGQIPKDMKPQLTY